jgi:hypothetical protein
LSSTDIFRFEAMVSHRRAGSSFLSAAVSVSGLASSVDWRTY